MEDFYRSAQNSHSPDMWQTFTDPSEEEFDALFHIACEAFRKTFQRLPFGIQKRRTMHANLVPEAPQRK